MYFVNNKQVKINYIKRINDTQSNKLILFIPGAINTAEEMDNVLQQNNVSFNYIALSIRGRGASDSPTSGYSLEDQSSDVISIIEAFKNEYQITLFAHSVGVPITINALKDNFDSCVHALILSDFAPFYPPFDKNWSDSIKNENITSITNIALDGIVNEAKYIDVADILVGIKIPVYLFVGTTQFSALRDLEKNKLQELKPELKIIDINNAGHELLFENPIDTIQEINKIVAN